MTFTHKSKRLLYMMLSIYAYVQCTLFIGKPAHLLFYLTAPKVDGTPLLFSPYNMISYFNIVFYAGLLVSGLLFIIATEPLLKHRVKNKKFFSIPLAMIMTPIYFIMLYFISTGVQVLFKSISA